MNLNKVCLCFEAFQYVDDTWISICEPVLSKPINNMSKYIDLLNWANFMFCFAQIAHHNIRRSKSSEIFIESAETNELKITRLSTNISDANGNEDIFLFVEKVGRSK